MKTTEHVEDVACAVCVDMGTTNTRVWLTGQGRVIARAVAGVGVRDTARDGTNERVRTTLRDLISKVRLPVEPADAGAQPPGVSSGVPACVPSYVVAAGMITSPLGLVEVPHVAAPAGLAQLAARIEHHSFTDVTDLPILLVPGVRSGPAPCCRETVGSTDVMRGEETLCVGLLKLGLVKPKGTLLNLGSHWKAIRVDAEGRVASSLTSMSGELVHAAQTQTILASAVPHERPSTLDQEWVEAGMNEQRQSGLARALFCVRLLEQASSSTPEQRLAFLVGAFIAADLDALVARGIFTADAPVAIAGGGTGLAAAWARALAQRSVDAMTLEEAQVEQGLLTGLRSIVANSAATK